MDGGRTPERHQGPASQTLSPLNRVRARRVGHVLVHQLADPERGVRLIQPEFRPWPVANGRRSPVAVERDRATREETRIDASQHHVRVGDGGVGPAPAVGHRARFRPGARRSHLDAAEVVHRRDGPAPGPDLDHLDHRNADRQPAPLLEAVAAGHLEGARLQGSSPVDHAQLRGCAPHVVREDVAQLQPSREVACQNRTSRGTGFHQPHGRRHCGFERGEPAPGGHEQEGTVEPRGHERLRQPLQVAGHQRLDIGVGARGRKAFVLAHLRADIRGQRHRKLRAFVRENRADAPLVVRVGVPVNEPHGDGLDPVLIQNRQQRAHRILVERHQHAPVPVHALGDGQTHAALHKGLRPVDADVVLLEAVLARHFEGVAMSRCDDQSRARPSALDDRVGRQRGPVDDQPHLRGRHARDLQHLVHTRQDPLFGGRGRSKYLGGDRGPACLEGHIGKGASDVDGQAHAARARTIRHGAVPRLHRSRPQTRFT